VREGEDSQEQIVGDSSFPYANMSHAHTCECTYSSMSSCAHA